MTPGEKIILIFTNMRNTGPICQELLHLTKPEYTPVMNEVARFLATNKAEDKRSSLFDSKAFEIVQMPEVQMTKAQKRFVNDALGKVVTHVIPNVSTEELNALMIPLAQIAVGPIAEHQEILAAAPVYLERHEEGSLQKNLEILLDTIVKNKGKPFLIGPYMMEPYASFAQLIDTKYIRYASTDEPKKIKELILHFALKDPTQPFSLSNLDLHKLGNTPHEDIVAKAQEISPKRNRFAFRS